MITLLNCSQDPEYRSKIGIFSENLNLLMDQFTKEEVEVKKPKTNIATMAKRTEEASIIDDLNCEDLEIKDLGIKTGIINYYKWIKKVIRTNFVSVSLHLSVLLFLRELSKKKLFTK